MEPPGASISRNRAANPLKGRATLQERRMPDQKAKAGLLPRDLRDTGSAVPFQCGETSLLADGPESKGIFPLACNCWDCDECGPNRLAQLRAMIMAGKPTVMLTLTERPNPKTTPEAQARRQTEAWKKL